MKHWIPLCLALGPLIAAGQAPMPTSLWRVTQLNFGTGLENDHFQRMSLDHMMAFAKTSQPMQRDLNLFDEEVSTVTRGLGLFASASFSRLKPGTGDYSTTSEVQVGVGVHSPREAMVTYKNKDMDTSIVYCNLQRELTLETAYLFKGKWGRHLYWYAGLGMNGGMTFDNKMVLIEGRYLEPGEHPSTQPEDEVNKLSYAAKRAYYTRFYVPYGLHYGIGPKWSVGLDFRTGMGLQFITGEDPNTIKKTGAFIIGAKFRL